MAKKKNQERNYIELFAGCGGMSLGLESAGFERIFANEISPMAAETFAYNLVSGARKAGELNPSSPDTWKDYFTFIDEPAPKADWMSFRDWRERKKLPLSRMDKAKSIIFSGDGPNLLVGDVGRLRELLESLKNSPKFRKRFGLVGAKKYGAVDLIAGGPPCQSFSIAGKREKGNARNQLFREFVRIVEIIRPKVVLFENVQGIMRPFTDESGHEWHPWHEVCRVFYQAGYLPVPSLVNAVDYGVPQSRPRFIMVAVHIDIAKKAETKLRDNNALAEAFRRAKEYYESEGKDTGLVFRPSEKSLLPAIWPSPLLPPPTHIQSSQKVSVKSAIGDLPTPQVDTGECSFESGSYAKGLNKKLRRPNSKGKIVAPTANHKRRKHCPRTEVRFRLLRELSKAGLKSKNMKEVSKNKDEAAKLLIGRELLFNKNGKAVPRKVRSKAQAIELIESVATSKNVQRCLIPKEPAGAQLSIPDDYIHWADDRVLTIREMARIQSFPDWFEFRSKETTGGSARAYEVPQYTQVGNAVPPLLAKAFGDSILGFLEQLDL